jgi:hypothetical protein
MLLREVSTRARPPWEAVACSGTHDAHALAGADAINVMKARAAPMWSSTSRPRRAAPIGFASAALESARW